MKLSPIFVFLLLTTYWLSAQFEYGFKGGLNFDTAGDIQLVEEQLLTKGTLSSKAGFHLGVYTQIDFLVLYLRPELQFTKVQQKFEDNTLENSRIELPISLGLKLLGPLSVFAGPTAFFNLSQDSNRLNLENVKNNTSIGMHLGTRIKLGPVGVDFRYERGLSKIESRILSQAGLENAGQLDLRPNQFTLGISFRLN